MHCSVAAERGTNAEVCAWNKSDATLNQSNNKPSLPVDFRSSQHTPASSEEVVQHQVDASRFSQFP